MTPEQVGQILAMAAAVDQYAPQPSELVLATWHAMLDRVPMPAAEKALMAHYRTSAQTITPSDIVNAWRDARRHELEERDRLQPVASPEVTHSGVDRALQALAERKAITAGEATETAVAIAEGETAFRRDIRSRACAHCGAQPGQPCVDHRGKPLTQNPAHPARIAGVQVAARQPVDGQRFS